MRMLYILATFFVMVSVPSFRFYERERREWVVAKKSRYRKFADLII